MPLTKKEIILRLSSNHQQFIELLFTLNETDFVLCVNNKWTPGQHFEHIYLSVSPLTTALKLPQFALRLLFGKANRPSKTYETLVQKYHDKLEKGGAASGRFIPKQIAFEQREKSKRSLLTTVRQLCKAVDGYTEQALDTHILPHPLLGKLTLREMLYFTIYHVEHHHKLLVQTVARSANMTS
jgi:hypothetical protein